MSLLKDERDSDGKYYIPVYIVDRESNSGMSHFGYLGLYQNPAYRIQM